MTNLVCGLTLVVAADQNNVIGSDGDLPWHLPDDLKHFKALTLGRPIVMGRKTFESIGRPLPGRENRVISRDPDYAPDGVVVFRTIDDALSDDAVVIGGGQVYAQTLEHAARVELTRVHTEVDGDTQFPALDIEYWRCVAREYHPRDAKHAYPFAFETWVRSSPSTDGKDNA